MRSTKRQASCWISTRYSARTYAKEKRPTNVGCSLQVAYKLSQPWPFPSSLMIGCVATMSEDEIRRQKISVDYHELDEARWFDVQEVSEMLARTTQVQCHCGLRGVHASSTAADDSVLTRTLPLAGRRAGRGPAAPAAASHHLAPPRQVVASRAKCQAPVNELPTRPCASVYDQRGIANRHDDGAQRGQEV